MKKYLLILAIGGILLFAFQTPAFAQGRFGRGRFGNFGNHKYNNNENEEPRNIKPIPVKDNNRLETSTPEQMPTRQIRQRDHFTISGIVVKIDMKNKSFTVERFIPWYHRLFGSLFAPRIQKQVNISTDENTAFLQQIKGGPWNKTDFLNIQPRDRVLVKGLLIKTNNDLNNNGDTKTDNEEKPTIHLAREVKIFLNAPRLRAHPPIRIRHPRPLPSPLNLSSSSTTIIPKEEVGLRDTQKAITVLERQVQHLNDIILKLQKQVKELQDKINNQ